MRAALQGFGEPRAVLLVGVLTMGAAVVKSAARGAAVRATISSARAGLSLAVYVQWCWRSRPDLRAAVGDATRSVSHPISTTKCSRWRVPAAPTSRRPDGWRCPRSTALASTALLHRGITPPG